MHHVEVLYDQFALYPRIRLINSGVICATPCFYETIEEVGHVTATIFLILQRGEPHCTRMKHIEVQKLTLKGNKIKLLFCVNSYR